MFVVVVVIVVVGVANTLSLPEVQYSLTER
jgi:hypothetical protein